MYSLLIKQARLIDGTGQPERICDVAVEGDRIVNIAAEITSGAELTIHANGKVLAPGFIDVQNHSDSHWQIFDNPQFDSLITQGFTSIILGNAGASLAPLLSEEALLSLQKWHALEGTNINWRSFHEFASTMSTKRFGCNVGSLVGYSTLRRGLVGDRTSPLTIDELEALKKAYADALESGAFGLSTGLAYAHEVLISEIELYELAKLTAEYQAMFSIHMRNEADEIIESVREAISLAQQANCNVKIAHFKIRNHPNWDKLNDVLQELEVAWHQGTNIHFDVYPYTSTWQPLYSYLPRWAIQGGRKHLLAELKNPIQHNKILTALNNSDTHIKDLVIASTSTRLQVNGKTMGKLAADMEMSSEQAMLKLIENGGSEVLVFDNCLDENGVTTLLEHPLGIVATNGSGFSLRDQARLVHPRCFGTAPKYLRQAIVGNRISLPEAIRKLTSAPASKLGITERGIIAIDAYADLVLFDPEAISDLATMTNPYQFSRGIEYVWVNGVMSVKSGVPTGRVGGSFLAKQS
jgi:N-acyl-D-aspartate/D-glutamate deacylase